IPPLQKAGSRVLTELNEQGFTNEAAEIAAWLKTILPSMPSLETKEVLTKRPILPTHCPSCGAGLRPDEVEWLDDVTAECAYCGNPVREDI
ncbi:MAG TPA: hypothetical protein VN843_16505, partial [Anaerolineales bacterium]|nr:hypothetical protein [Anaerolineales bacterium]